MELLDKKITDFIKEHHVLTLATSVDNVPYCANCFYAYMEKENALVFTSDMHTRHARESIQNNQVAGSIVLETSVVGKIQGIQFTGSILLAEQSELRTVANKKYMKRFPFAKLMDTTLWIVSLDYIKMTDNRLGFGKKLIWNK